MIRIRTRVRVAADGTLSARVASEVPPGEHEAEILISDERSGKPSPLSGFPVHDTPWLIGHSSRREDIYGDDGR
jgi:hypothetical protein